MFNIEFYTDADGTSELWNFLDDLQKKQRLSAMTGYQERDDI